ncbi:MAG: VOC family protein [Janthinobacterium lividum]
MRLRSIELACPNAAEAARFMTETWGMALAGKREKTWYLRGSGTFPYLISIAESGHECVHSTTFVGSRLELSEIAQNITAAGFPARPEKSLDLGGGEGLLVEMPEGEIFRFLAEAEEAEPIEGHDLPKKLTHCVFNSVDADQTGHVAEEVLGFRISDRTRGMVFVRCNESHHSTAFARAGIASLNHIAFEMTDTDAVMRGIGRLRDRGMVPAWGPGRHGPGANVFAYFVAPFGGVVEFSTAVELVSDDYKVGSPEDWTWPEGRIDQWGLSDKDNAGLRAAEERFRFRRDWTPAPLTDLIGASIKCAM